jgi:hypothetical protein
MGLNAHTSPNDGIEHCEENGCCTQSVHRPSVFTFCVALLQSGGRLSEWRQQFSQELHSDFARAVDQDRGDEVTTPEVVDQKREAPNAGLGLAWRWALGSPGGRIQIATIR